MPQRVTLKDIARACGLSVSGASIALRNDPRVPEATAARVRAVADQLGYIPNQAASNLRRARTDTVAICLGDISNPIFNDILMHVEREADQRGKRLMLGISREQVPRQEDFIRQAIRHGADALVLCPAYDTTAQDLARVLLRNDRMLLPSALVFRSVADFPVPQITSDEVGAGRMMAQAGLRAGHRRFHWIGGGQHTSAAVDRQAGALAELREAGVTEIAVHNGPTTHLFGFQTVQSLHHAGMIAGAAVLCFSDLIALGALSGCHEVGLHPGRDVSVIGCDDMEGVRFAVPPLSTVRIDIPAIVRRAMARVLDNPAGAELVSRETPPVTEAIPAGWIARRTVRPG